MICFYAKIIYHRKTKINGIDVISFLPADVKSEAFNRPKPWSKEKVSSISLTPEGGRRVS